METIFANSEKSKTYDCHRLLFNLSGKIDLTINSWGGDGGAGGAGQFDYPLPPVVFQKVYLLRRWWNADFLWLLVLS